MPDVVLPAAAAVTSVLSQPQATITAALITTAAGDDGHHDSGAGHGGQDRTVAQEVVVADSPRVRYIKTLKRALEINGEALDRYHQGAPADPPVPQSAPRPASTRPAGTRPASTRRRAS